MDDKIYAAIKRYVSQGSKNFVIFPYGTYGKKVKKVLNEIFKIQEIALVDNILSADSDEIISLEELTRIQEKYVVLFSVSNGELYQGLLEKLKEHTNCEICQVALENKNIFFDLGFPKMQIEKCDKKQLEHLLEITKMTWTKLGEEEPYWSVLTHKEYLTQNMDQQAKDKFYASGVHESENIIATLLRNEIIKEGKSSKALEITEIGCGTGRVTNSLAENFKHVMAVDISRGNIEIARENVRKNNVEFKLIKQLEEYTMLPKTDVVYSMIVLQHNCPPVIEYILDAALRSLNGGGIAIFQVPTYSVGYSFSYDEYLRDNNLQMEMHVIPQKTVFEIAQKNDCVPMEVYGDASTGRNDFSTVFVLKKNNENKNDSV